MDNNYHNDLNNSFFSISDSSCDLNDNDSFQSIPSLNENLNSTFLDISSNFNVAHINAQSIPAHYADLLSTFADINLHAILISESWFKSSHPSTAYSLPSYHLLRNDRLRCGGGGVAIYLKSHIPFTIVKASSQMPDELEYLFIEVLLSGSKLLLGVLYCPSLSINYFNTFEKILEDLLPLYDNTIVMGDFNTCLIKNDWRALRLQSIANSVNLSILPLCATHFFPNCAPSLLDLIFVSSPNLVATHGQFNAEAFSYHDLVYVSYQVRPPKRKSKILLKRNYNSVNATELLSDASKLDWSAVLNAGTLDEQVAIFNSLINQLFDLHAPVRPVRVKHLPAPWLTDEIKQLQAKRNRAKLSYRSNPSNCNAEKYRVLRNQCNRLCRDSRRRHIHSAVLDEKDPARVWKFLKSLGVGKTDSITRLNGQDLDALNKQFASSCSIDTVIKANTLNLLRGSHSLQISPFTFVTIVDSDVRKEVLSVTSDAAGCDGISSKMVLPILDILLPSITSIFNTSISNGIFPSIWKNAEIILIPKKPNPSCASDYRPISLLPFLSKILERLIYKQLNSFLLKNHLHNPLQSGFRTGHSTATALVKVTDDIRHAMEERKLTVLVLLDFSNAFNTVDFDILLGILETLSISQSAINWFHSYLHGRCQRIRATDSFSPWCNIDSGVPQGGVLSPLLFALFINKITNNITSSYHLYADDLQIYSHATLDNLPRCIDTINEDLMRISEWSKSYGLQLNPLKTQVTIIGSSRLITKLEMANLCPISLNGITIPYSDQVKNLGIIFDQRLSWVPQTCVVSKRIFGSAASLRRLSNFLPEATKIMLAQTLLLPLLDYADVTYLDISEELLSKLERLQNLCIRFIFGLRKFDHITEFRKKLNWLPIRQRRDAHILFLLYQLLFYPSSPTYLKDRFIYLSNTHNLSLRSSYTLHLQTPVHSSSFYSKSFTVRAVYLWNSLPLHIRKSQSLNTFKRLVKDYLLNK